MAETATTALIESMPKAEIHIHLEGAIQPETVLDLAERHGRLQALPSDQVSELRKWFQFSDFPHFVEVYFAISDLLRTPEDFALIVHACGADMAAQNILYRELTFTPFIHTNLQKKSLSIEEVLAGLDRGREQAYDDYGVEMRWIFDIPRNACFPRGYRSQSGEKYDAFPAQRTLEYALLGRDHGVIGCGLGGYEVGAPPEPFAHVFDAARAAGLLSVPHAGETMGPDSVRGAIEHLGADRIGHGVRAIEDPDLLALLRERQIPLEINPTSNICLHVYRRIAEHPLPHLDRMGLLVTVNSDDPPLFNTNLNREYALLVSEFGYSVDDVVRIARNAFRASGAEPALKQDLLDQFDRWAGKAGVGGVSR